MKTYPLTESKVTFNEIGKALIASLLLALASKLSIPAFPVPFTLQTMTLFCLALYLKPTTVFAATGFYLLEASMGLPVLQIGSNPLWYMGPTSGYLIAFPFAAYLIARLAPYCENTLSRFMAILLGQVVIYLLGFATLSNLIGYQQAFYLGVVLFVPSALLKNMLTCLVWKKMRG